MVWFAIAVTALVVAYLGCVVWDVHRAKVALSRLSQAQGPQAERVWGPITSVGASLDDLRNSVRLRLNALEWQIDLAHQLQRHLPSGAKQLLATEPNNSEVSERDAMQLVIDDMSPKLRAAACALLILGQDGKVRAVWEKSKGVRFEAALTEHFEPWLRHEVDMVAGGRVDLIRQGAQPIVFFGFREAIIAPFELTIAGQARRGVLWAGYQPPISATDLEEHVVRMAAEETVRQVTAACVVKDLSGRMEEAELAAREKSEFLAYMSHDIRTPLNNIKNIFALLREETAEDERQELIAMGMANTQNMTELLTTILDFTRHRVGKLSADRQTFDLGLMVSDLARGFQASARSKGIELIVQDSEPSRVKIVHADPQQIKRVIGNLISNAIKFTDKGTVTIEVGKLEGADLEAISVSDTGRGMAPAQIRTLFTPFTRFDRTVEGIGLGLALSKVLTEINGGALSVESELGRGTRFSIRLPNAGQGVIDPAVTQQSAGAERVVLVADDDRDVVETTSRILERAGFRTLRALSMAEALKLLEREALDALVCDRHLGDGSVEQIRQFLETSGRSEVPVIVLSGDSSLAELRAKGLPALEKPVDPESLLREIERTLGRHPVAIGG